MTRYTISILLIQLFAHLNAPMVGPVLLQTRAAVRLDGLGALVKRVTKDNNNNNYIST